MASVERVLITGVSGFIALVIAKKLLEEGKYQVRGTVRSLKNESKLKSIKELVKDPRYPLELVEADLEKDDGWDAAVNDCSYVIHVASPFVMLPKNKENQLIKPAVEGTLRVLHACSRAKSANGTQTVKRVVLTSSVAAIAYGREKSLPKSYVYSESDFSDETTISAYAKSKLLAERAAWDFVKTNNSDGSTHHFELSAICPSMVVGKYYGNTGTSLDLLKDFMNGKLPFLPDAHMGFVDVHDVADAHLTAMTSPIAADQRYLISERTMSFKEVAQVLNKEFQSQGVTVSEQLCPFLLAKVIAKVNMGAAEVMPGWGHPRLMSHDKASEELGIQFAAAPKAILDSVYCMIERGDLPKPKKYKGSIVA